MLSRTTITALSRSPAEMFLNGEIESLVNDQSKFYVINKKVMSERCKTLEEFYPLLIDRLSNKRNSSFSRSQWLHLSKSIIHIFLAFLIDLQIVDQASRKHILVDDIVISSALYQQTQENLVQSLPFDAKLRRQMLHAALSLSKGRLVKIDKSIKLEQVFSIRNLKYYLAKKANMSHMVSFETSNKVVIGIVGMGSLFEHLGGLIKKRYNFVNFDSILNSFYSFPELPNLKLRRILEDEIEDIFRDIDLPKLFPVFKTRNLSAKTLAMLISTLLPINGVEKYRKNEVKAKEILNGIKPALMLTSAGHHDENANLFLGQSSQLRMPLITLQHGSGYAEYSSMQTERVIETGLYQSLYLSWGKGMKRIGNKTTVFPLGSPYLNSLPREGFKFKKIRRILVPLEPIYFYQIFDGFIPTQPGFIYENYMTLIKTLEFLHKQYPQLSIVIKVKRGHERQYSIRKYLSKELASEVVFTGEGKTYDYFDKETLVILPTLSGAFHEAMMAEIPFLLYLPKNQMFLKNNVVDFFNVLRKNFLCGSTSGELIEALNQQLGRSVNYGSLRKEFEKYQEFACIRSKRWHKVLETKISDVAA